MILRVPDELAQRLHSFIDEKGEKESTVLLTPKIVRNSDNESVTQFDFQYGNFVSTASILDLPCVIESHKTLDDINVYKCGNISQMVYVHPNGERFLEDVPNFQFLACKQLIKSGNEYKVRYLARDGLTPPTKDIRNRFFRKEFPVERSEIREVEQEMVSILKEMKDKNEDSKKNVSHNSEIDDDIINFE